MIRLLTGLLVLQAAVSVCLLDSSFAQTAADDPPADSPTETAEPALEADISLYDLFSEIVVLQQEGRYADASEMLESHLAENEESEDVFRSLLDQLVHNHYRWRNGTVEEVATRALYRHPDLQADKMWTDPDVQELYDRLRGELFGSLTIKNPEGCAVYLDSLLVDEATPYEVPYLKVGEYDLRVTKERHHDYHEMILVEPGVDLVFEEIPLSGVKDARWWLSRTGLTGLAGGLIWVVASGGSGGSDPQPLDEAPGTP